MIHKLQDKADAVVYLIHIVSVGPLLTKDDL